MYEKVRKTDHARSQILNEAKRIRKKHLLTIEPGISEKQTAQMQAANMQLVIPQGLHKTYTPAHSNG